MNPHTASLLEAQTHPAKRRGLAIARAVRPNLADLSVIDAALFLLDVDAVLAGEGTPRLSQKERDAITAAAARIPEELRP